MKVLILSSVFFRLPDDFKGSLGDALRALAEYHDEVVKSGASPDGLSVCKFQELPLREAVARTFDKFLEAVETGKRLCGLLQLKEWSHDNDAA
jgi:hypothetical protein